MWHTKTPLLGAPTPALLCILQKIANPNPVHYPNLPDASSTHPLRARHSHSHAAESTDKARQTDPNGQPHLPSDLQFIPPTPRDSPSSSIGAHVRLFGPCAVNKLAEAQVANHTLNAPTPVENQSAAVKPWNSTRVLPTLDNHRIPGTSRSIPQPRQLAQPASVTTSPQ